MGKYDKGHTYPFTATRADVGMTYYAITGKPEGEPPDPFDFIYSPWCIPLFLVDLPFSIVTDIVTLPYDLYHWKDIEKQTKEPQHYPAPYPEPLRVQERRGSHYD